MKKNVIYKDLGLIEYAQAWKYQQRLSGEISELKRNNAELSVCEQSPVYNYLLLCEHPHVYTLGKSGKTSNLLVDENFLLSKGASFYKTDRGGDITYHGPGQIVGYPIFDLEWFGLGIKKFVFNLEEAIIRTLAEFSVTSERLAGATGVWIDTNDPQRTRKICAIGIRVARFITMHGFALNVNTNLDYFGFINPCGFTDKGVTSMKKETGTDVDINSVRESLVRNFADVFGFIIEPTSKSNKERHCEGGA